MENRLKAGSRPVLIMTKWCGLEDTARLAGTARAAEHFPEHFLRTARSFDSLLSTEEDRKAAEAAGVPEEARLEPGCGGILAGLWFLCERFHAGMRVNLKDIPLRQETIELTNYFDLNPYELNARGCLLMAAEDERVLEAMRDRRVQARIIGYLCSTNSRVLINGEEIRYLDMPRQTLREMGLWNGKDKDRRSPEQESSGGKR